MTNETTASQPKSIGDDAQFHGLMSNHNYAQKQGDFDQRFAARKNLVAYIDNFRAPAAQASATIQAAPRTSFADYWWEARHERRTQEDHAKAAWDFALKSAATIQEPVMVAEPVGDTPEMIQWRNIQNTVNAVADFCFGSKDHPVYGSSHRAVTTCLTARDGVQVTLEPLAAPMVADPAGVAMEQAAQICDKLFKERGGVAFLMAAQEIRSGAATVKAVPSEALDDAQRERIRDGLSIALGQAMDCTRVWSAWGVGTMSEDDFQLLADNDERLDELVDAVAVNLAAPLADKTGGGER